MKNTRKINKTKTCFLKKKLSKKRLSKKYLAKKQNKNTIKKRKGGMKVGTLATGALLLSSLGTACGSKHIMTACAGNTCRSPVAEKQIQSVLGSDYDGKIVSRGVNVRQPGAPMAPYSGKFSMGYCDYGDVGCIEDVESHHSTPFECGEIESMAKNPTDTVQIIPMDDAVADNINARLDSCNFKPEIRGRVNVGLDCNNGVCGKKSANVPDPFFKRGTPAEKGAYVEMQDQIRNVVSNEFKTCPRR